MAVKVFDTKGVDSREKARFHVNMITGTRFGWTARSAEWKHPRKNPPAKKAKTVDLEKELMKRFRATMSRSW
jgi:hypothetical protein